jgi:CRP-like cAMP-binding protein
MRELLHHTSTIHYIIGSNATWCEASLHNSDNDWTSNHCGAEHPVWHIGQFFLFIAYIFGMLSTVYNIRRYKYIGVFRFLIFFSSIFLVAWADAVASSVDQTIYYSLFLVINFFQLLYIYYYEKPITLNDYLHNLWHKMFNMNGYNLELLDFYNLMQEKAFLKTYKSGQTYISEGDIPTQLSILLSGKMAVYKRDDFQRKSMYMVHHSTAMDRRTEKIEIGTSAYCGAVYPYEFIDSYEWLMSQGIFKYEGTQGAAAAGGTSQVTIKVSDDAMITECVVLTWKKEMLEAIFKEHPRLRVCIHSLVGRDIADKMLRITGHSIGALHTDVDMVRKAHSPFRPTMRADVKNAHQTELERQILPIPVNRAATILDDKYSQMGPDGTPIDCPNLTPVQDGIKDALGAGPWCDLPDEELLHSPWTTVTGWDHVEVVDKDGNAVLDAEGKPMLKLQYPTNVEPGNPRPTRPGDMQNHLLEQAMHSLQRSRLRITNSRLLGMNPGALESLQPSSDMHEQNQVHGAQLLRYFDENMPDLKKKDLHEILKWGRWRTYYRPGTVIVRQGEEAHYVGLVLQGRLALYTEDEITRSKSLVTYVDKFDLVGSEDFSSKFRTARRTIQMPRYVDPASSEFVGENVVDPPQQLPKTLRGEEIVDEDTQRRAQMYESMSVEKPPGWPGTEQKPILSMAEEWVKKNIPRRNTVDLEYLEERIKVAQDNHESSTLITKIPTVMYVWDIKDLKRLMLADPHVESSLSALLRSDITFKLNHAQPAALGTRLCGVPTQARGDQDIRMCAVHND